MKSQIRHLSIMLASAALLYAGTAVAADKNAKKKGKGQETAPASPAIPGTPKGAVKSPDKQEKPDSSGGVGSRLKEIQQEARGDTPAGGTETSTIAEREELPEGEPGSRLSKEESEPPRPASAQDIEAANSKEMLKLLERDLDYYRAGEESFHAGVKQWIRQQYNAQKEQLAGQYDRAVDELEQEERARRAEAIARFEEFLKRYPNDPTYTPDAMFRLAELYFEKSSDEYLGSSKNYEKQLAAFERGERPDEPAPPEPHYEKVIGLHQELLSRFPNYRLADAAEYLVGYCFSEQGQPDEALSAFQKMVAEHPDSKFVAEVWTRIGEIHFDKNERKEVEAAIEAYAKVLKYKDSPYYDKALYKIAWSYYRLDKFPEAVKSFIELVQYADDQKKLTGKTGSELRAEAIQYIGVSLADEDWGGLNRAKETLEPLGDKGYVGEIWKRYGEILYDQTRYPIAIQVLEYTLAKHPNAPYNPEIQSKIVNAYEQQRDFDGATAAREKLVRNYSDGSPWFNANKNDKDAVAQARALTEKSLYTAAIFRHQQAQAFKAAGRLDEARKSYQAAAAAYRGYLAQFPQAKNAYDFEFFLAECLYYSDDYMEAAAQYDKVRDSTMDNKHLDAAALSAVITYDKEIERLEATGKLAKYDLKTGSDRGDKPPEPKAVEPIYQKLIDASDRYIRLLPKGDRAPAIAYRAAEIYYKHDQLEESRKRFEAIIGMAPGTDVAAYSGNLIIETYLATKDWDNVETWSKRLGDLAKAPPEKALSAEEKKRRDDLADTMSKFNVGAKFKKAEKFDAEGNFEDAANTYVTLVNENPKHEFADKALFNAAVDYEKVKRFETASNVYQRITDEYPKSALAPKALFRVGVNYEKGYDFPSAIAAYNKLVERYPDSENRADALYNEAVTLENMQQYAQAAQAFKKYATTFEKREDAGENYYRSALVYEKMKAWPEMIDTIKAFITKYKTANAQKERIVEAYLKMGQAYASQKNEKESLAAYNQCVKEYAGRHIAVDRPASADVAKATFEIAEADFRKYDLLRISGRGAQATALAQKAKMQRQVEKEYTDVFKYKRADTTLAASYRIGYSYERFAESMFNAEIPPEFANKPEFADEYKAQLEEKAGVLERKAEQAYRKALDEAKKTHVTNEWTERIMEGLNKYQPKEFPAQRQGKPLLQTFTISGNGLDALGNGAKGTKAPASSGQTEQKPGEKRTAEAKSGGQ